MTNVSQLRILNILIGRINERLFSFLFLPFCFFYVSDQEYAISVFSWKIVGRINEEINCEKKKKKRRNRKPQTSKMPQKISKMSAYEVQII